MKTTTTFSEFSDRFSRSYTYKDNFSYEWLRALFDYLEEYEEETNQEIEFNMVALCCEYTEYESIKDAFIDYYTEDEYIDFCEQNQTDDPEIVEQVRNDSALEYLKNNTQVIEMENGGIILQNF